MKLIPATMITALILPVYLTGCNNIKMESHHILDSDTAKAIEDDQDERIIPGEEKTFKSVFSLSFSEEATETSVLKNDIAILKRLLESNEKGLIRLQKSSKADQKAIKSKQETIKLLKGQIQEKITKLNKLTTKIIY